jgi:hypothetical protein
MIQAKKDLVFNNAVSTSMLDVLSQGARSPFKSRNSQMVASNEESTQVDRVITESHSLRFQMQRNIQMQSQVGLDNTKYRNLLSSTNLQHRNFVRSSF